MTHTLKTLLIAAATLVVMGGAAHANPDADVNQDGKISKAEFMDAANQRFRESDSNEDLMVSKEERTLHREARQALRQAERFDQMDTDQDGMISRSEFSAFAQNHRQKRHLRRDFNGDGEVDRADRQARREKFKERWEKRAERRQGLEGRNWHPDTNEDGFISWDEHKSASEKMFERLDKNSDGYLEKGESRRPGFNRHRGR